jgi:hypothetical protein
MSELERAMTKEEIDARREEVTEQLEKLNYYCFDDDVLKALQRLSDTIEYYKLRSELWYLHSQDDNKLAKQIDSRESVKSLFKRIVELPDDEVFGISAYLNVMESEPHVIKIADPPEIEDIDVHDIRLSVSVLEERVKMLEEKMKT